jgi:predicted Zn-dependent peptidase
MEFRQKRLSNGLSIVAEVNPDAHSMAVGFFVKTGSRDETPEISGVSHFLEHMVFKGTERRTPFDVNLDFDRMGAQYNAFTSEENTVFYGCVLPEYRAGLVDLLGDILRPSLRGEDFDMEKNVILDEIALYEDQPHFRVYDKLMSVHFAGHPLGNSILGSKESIAALKQEQMKAYFDRRYSAGNISVVGVGNLDFDAFVADVGGCCEGWNDFDVHRATPESAPDGRREVIRDPKVLREHVGLMSAAPACQSEDRFAAELLSAIVGDDTGSRLYYALIEPGIADEASTSYSSMDRAGGFLTFVSADADKAARAVEIASGVLDQFEADGPTDAELEAARNKIAASATLHGEVPMGRLTVVGFDWVYRRAYEPLGDKIDRILAVTRDEVHRLARECGLSRTSVVALGPLEKL